MHAKGIHAARKVTTKPCTSSAYVPPRTKAEIASILDAVEACKHKIELFVREGFVPKAVPPKPEVVLTSLEDIYNGANELLAEKNEILRDLHMKLKDAEEAKARAAAERKDAHRMAKRSATRAGAGCAEQKKMEDSVAMMQLRFAQQKCERRAAAASAAAIRRRDREIAAETNARLNKSIADLERRFNTHMSK